MDSRLTSRSAVEKRLAGMTPSAVIGALTNLSLPGNSPGKRQSAATTSLDDAETSRTAVRESGGQMRSTLPHSLETNGFPLDQPFGC